MNYSPEIDKLIYRDRVAEWPAVEIGQLLSAIYDQRGATKRQAQDALEYVIETIPED